jgi:hypothetical protein
LRGEGVAASTRPQSRPTQNKLPAALDNFSSEAAAISQPRAEHPVQPTTMTYEARSTVAERFASIEGAIEDDAPA